jgi:hypothetical protein
MITTQLAKSSVQLIFLVSRWVIGLTLIFVFSRYLIDAQERRRGEADCVWEAVLNYEDMPYSARWCKLNREKVMLRIFDVEGRRLLAERTFFQQDWPNFYWRSDALGYDTEPHGGLIALPPSVLDRWRAKLP